MSTEKAIDSCKRSTHDRIDCILDLVASCHACLHSACEMFTVIPNQMVARLADGLHRTINHGLAVERTLDRFDSNRLAFRKLLERNALNGHAFPIGLGGQMDNGSVANIDAKVPENNQASPAHYGNHVSMGHIEPILRLYLDAKGVSQN